MPWVVNWEQGHCSGWIGSSRTKMTLDEFRESLTATEPPAGLTHALTTGVILTPIDSGLLR
jgi:hypothetical protein